MARISDETWIDLVKMQDSIIASFSNASEPKNNHSRLVEAIVRCDESNLGEYANLLKKFACNASGHPEIDSPGEAWNQIVHHINSGTLKDKYNVYKSDLRQCIALKPRFTTNPTRFILRKEKNMVRNIGMKQVYMYGENAFFGKPDNFQMYARNSEAHLTDIVRLQDMQKLFANHKMPETSHTVEKRIQALREMHNESYLGFHHLKPTEAAVICARLSALRWHELYFLTVPFKYFDVKLWEGHDKKEKEKEEDKQKEDMKKILAARDRKAMATDNFAFTYQPRIYPLDMFDTPPQRVRNIIAACDSMAELNNCPAFDYYWVVVPSINVNHPYFKNKDTWRILANNEVKVFDKENEATRFLDIYLAVNHYFTPVVLGEREGHCHFICAWL